MSCPFCIENWENLDMLADLVTIEGYRVAIINPLNPVSVGHRLVICGSHVENAAQDPRVAGALMRSAAWWVAKTGTPSANIITSIGSPATQTVFHLHVHVVPRRADDGLKLPWTGQVKES